MARWFLVRHGETDWNVECRAQGQSDTPLNDLGLSQVERLAARLAPVPFAAAYASDLKRVTDTAKAILDGRSLLLQKIPELREKSYGEWEGMTYKDVEIKYPDLFKRLFEDDFSFAPPGGESDSELFTRIKAVVNRLKAVHTGDESVLVVGHGGSLRAFVLCLLGLPLEYMWRFRLVNASVSTVSVFTDGVGATLDLWNDISHLEIRNE
jgi:probable phosphoglycerate mutase